MTDAAAQGLPIATRNSRSHPTNRFWIAAVSNIFARL
jgi:hypothetical protein